MTHRLYYTDSYLRDFEAVVTERSDDAKRIYLDRTAFYPTSGGQPFDTGKLGDIPVVEVVDEGEQVAHLLAAPLREERVTGRIDWPRRFDHMQQHTGQHLLSAVIAELLGRSTLAVHFGQQTSTVDIDGESLSPDQVSQVEARANEAVTDNRPVEVYFQDADAVEGLRKPSTRGGSIRIVSIRDLDRSACGGTHVRFTGEVGAILLRKVERVRSATRLEFLCGGRAVRQARQDYALLGEMAAELTAPPTELPGLIQRMRVDLKQLRTESHQLQGELDSLRARELYSATEVGPDGVRRVLYRDETGPMERLRGLAQTVASMPRAVFVGAVSRPPGLIVAASKDAGVDVGKMLKGLLASAGGRGGGSAGLAQGVVPEPAQLESLIEVLLQLRRDEGR